jgi:hypothetical protein
LDLGTVSGPPPTGAVGPQGGTVSRLFFAVVGDSRPAQIDDTANYPTAIINQIYADIEAMNPRPQFVISTGDYMFARPSGDHGAAQMSLYQKAAQQFTGGPLFAVLGNHECTGATAVNCTPGALTNNYNAFMSALIAPLNQQQPYYSVSFDAMDSSFTAKLIVVACNAWDAWQRSWLEGELKNATTFTFVARHEPVGTDAPCVAEMDALLGQYPYTLLIVGHSHTFLHSGKQLIVGNGGAPITGTTPFGYATVEQQLGGGFIVTQYESTTGAAIGRFVVP